MITKKLLKKTLFLALCALLVFNLCACPIREDDSKNDEMPPMNSLVTYTLDGENERLVLFHSETGTVFGEWYTNDRTVRVYAEEIVSRGETKYRWQLFETSGYEMFSEVFGMGSPTVLEPRVRFADSQRCGYLNAGLLHSTELILVDQETQAETHRTVTSITVEAASPDTWDWTDLEGWADFCFYDATTLFCIEELGITYIPWRNIGEWKIAEKTLSIKLSFYEEMQAVAIYDISNNQSRLMAVLNGKLTDEEHLSIRSFYGVYPDSTMVEGNISSRDLVLIKTQTE